ncbi:MAG: NirD/YgiW/YdeI family stress tolerance protein [Neisseria sp.]|nr:NirD/YgiW/YdeI family stress tolerance protein [Neisseria sp.]
MKAKLAMLMAAAALGMSGAAVAAETFGAGAASRATVQSVAEAKKLPDDTKVTLEGNVVKQISKERYEFRDRTGSITVEIDDEDWNGITVNARDTVRIDGEVEQKRNGTVEIDVDRVYKR